MTNKRIFLAVLLLASCHATTPLQALSRESITKFAKIAVPAVLGLGSCVYASIFALTHVEIETVLQQELPKYETLLAARKKEVDRFNTAWGRGTSPQNPLIVLTPETFFEDEEVKESLPQLANRIQALTKKKTGALFTCGAFFGGMLAFLILTRDIKINLGKNNKDEAEPANPGK